MKRDFSRFHPELQQIASRFPSFTFHKGNLGLLRLLSRLAPTPKAPQAILVENSFIPGQDDRTRIRLRIYRPRSVTPPTPALIWLHGGGYVMGTPEMDDVRCAHYAGELGATVVSVDYRRAPQYPFPAGLNDCYSALQWVQSHAEQIGADAGRIAVGGASAGGGLAVCLAHLAHDRQEIEPVFQLLVYPMLDDRTVLRTDAQGRTRVVWNQASNRFGWESYLGKQCGAAGVPEYAVAARRQDLSGLPRAWVGVGTEDLFYDESMAYAHRLNEAGVKCEVCAVPGAFHGFDAFNSNVPVVQDFRKSQIAALKDAYNTR